MFRFLFLTFAMGAMLWTGTPDARAELVMVDSLALRARAADVVVIGRVLNVATITKVVGGRTRATIEVSLASERVIKGKALKVYRYVDGANDRVKSGQRVLAFLSKADRFPDRFPAHFKGRLTVAPMGAMNAGEAILDLAKIPAQGLPTRDFAMERSEKGVVARVVAALATKGYRPGRVNLDAAFDSPVARAYYSGSAVLVAVPLDDVTEAQAVAELSAKEVWTRNAAVQVLAQFKSKSNIRRLKGLLSDPGLVKRTSKSGTTMTYLVRKTAYEALRKWGVKVRQPKLVKQAP